MVKIESKGLPKEMMPPRRIQAHRRLIQAVRMEGWQADLGKVEVTAAEVGGVARLYASAISR